MNDITVIPYLDDRVDWSGGPDACWPWLRAVDRDGYGVAYWDGKWTAAHRLAYSLAYGPIASGLTIDHLCHDSLVCVDPAACLHRRCVNPLHMETVTVGENSRRGGARRRNANKTHCPQGHLYDETNTYLARRANGRLDRQCRECHRLNELKRYHRLRGDLAPGLGDRLL